jgi:glycosidase
MQELRAYLPDIYCVGECWSGENEVVEYYSALNCFNFAMSQAEGKAATAAKGNSSISTFLNYVVTYQNKIKDKNPDSMAMSFLSNHDMDRIAGAFATENVMRMAANLYLLSPGSPVIYYGEELGMRGSRGSANTDANRRLAMLWGNDYQAKDPIGATYAADKQIQSTVVSQLEDANSLLNYYARLIAIRHKYEGIARGEYTAVTSSNRNVGGFLIKHEGETILLLHNTSNQSATIDLAKCAGLSGVSITEILDAIGVSNQVSLDGTQLTIGAQTTIILG